MKKIVILLLCTLLCCEYAMAVDGNSDIESVDKLKKIYVAEVLKYEGTVTILDSDGESVSLLKGMQLYSGYKVTTGSDGILYLSLDSERLVKLDNNSEITVKKVKHWFFGGTSLTIELQSGSMFFNIAKKLDDDESFDIAVSNMLIGIRGTSGYISINKDGTPDFYLVDGEVSITDSGTATGKKKIKGPYRVSNNKYKGDFLLKDLPKKIITEIALDTKLKKRVEASNKWNIDKFLKGEGIYLGDFETVPDTPIADIEIKGNIATVLAPVTNEQLKSLFNRKDIKTVIVKSNSVDTLSINTDLDIEYHQSTGDLQSKQLILENIEISNVRLVNISLQLNNCRRQQKNSKIQVLSTFGKVSQRVSFINGGVSVLFNIE